MKKYISFAVISAIFAGPAMAETIPSMNINMENPLFIPMAGQFSSKIGAGLMYKKADNSLSMQAKEHSGATEWPIYRANGNFGYGITDRLSVRAILAYTNTVDIDRKGMTDGRLGLNYRILDGMTTDGWVWDMYADLFLGGVSPMKAELIASPNNLGGTYPLSFNYANYSNGRYGAWLGTQVGKTWADFTVAAFAEVERTVGNNNNEITISDSAKNVVKAMITPKIGPALAGAYIAGLPETFDVDTKSTWEYSAGLKGFYEFNELWALGGGFTYKHRSANTVNGVNLDNSSDLSALSGGLVSTETVTKSIANQFMGSLQDGWDEYIVTAAVSRMITDATQVALYGEYTFDSADAKSQNGTDVKVEGGVRVNVLF